MSCAPAAWAALGGAGGGEVALTGSGALRRPLGAGTFMLLVMGHIGGSKRHTCDPQAGNAGEGGHTVSGGLRPPPVFPAPARPVPETQRHPHSPERPPQPSDTPSAFLPQFPSCACYALSTRPFPHGPSSPTALRASPGFVGTSPSFLAPERGFARLSLPPPGPHGWAGGPHPPLQMGCPRPRGLQRPAGGHVAGLRRREAEHTGLGPSPGPQLPGPRPRPAAGA